MARELPTSHRRWRVVRARVLARSTLCHLCGKPGADSVDHVVPVARGGAALDEANLAPAHLLCNQRKGTRRAPVPTPSRTW